VLDEESLLLEYALGDDNSYLWAVTKTGMTSYTLPKRSEIEKLARPVYELLTARQPKPHELPQQYRLRVKEAEAQYWDQAASLSQLVLGPVADQLGNRRLLIVAEGALQYVPFGALPKPQPEGKGGKHSQGSRSDEGMAAWTPLIVDHEILSLPSASVMDVLRRETKERKPAPKAVAVLADPVFEADDPRIKAARPQAGRTVALPELSEAPIGYGSKNEKSKPLVPGVLTARISRASGPQRASMFASRRGAMYPVSDMQRAVRDVGLSRDGLSVPRLLSTRQEANAIMSVSPPEISMMALGFQASRATATSSELSQYRIVHFATHGLLNSEHPELSGLVLSLIDEQGKHQNGFLRLHDIYNLNLPADLVVLSACNTALGKDVRGEGLVGIVRGFMYAGAARVVSSLWKVDDEATAELMKGFYRRMFQENMPPAAALRAAQVEMWKQKQWRSPYYWAAFVLQGEWK
jgi:CHAT domain-containing protein